MQVLNKKSLAYIILTTIEEGWTKIMGLLTKVNNANATVKSLLLGSVCN